VAMRSPRGRVLWKQSKQSEDDEPTGGSDL
jgi:hypothetical protein